MERPTGSSQIITWQRAGKELDGKWYYFCSTGSLAKNVWKAGANGIWYYLGQDGVMLTNTTTPDGYKVGADGAWIR